MKPRLPGNPVSVDEEMIEIHDIGLMDYTVVHELQLEKVERLVHKTDEPESIIVCQHPPVFTLGQRRNLDGLLLPREHIRSHGIDIVETERGGDITFHGPGQLVVYPLIRLRQRKLSVVEYIHMLEDIMLFTTGKCGVYANRDERNRGIWVGDAKLGSIGIRVRHGVTFHGLALNVSIDLAPFSYIRPCGLTGVGVTSLTDELGKDVRIEMVKDIMIKHIYSCFS